MVANDRTGIKSVNDGKREEKLWWWSVVDESESRKVQAMLANAGYCQLQALKFIDRRDLGTSIVSLLRKETEQYYSCLQLAARGFLSKANHQLAKLGALLHIFKQPIHALQIVYLGIQDSRYDWMDLLGLDEVDHLLELLSGTHRGSTHVDIFENSLHQEWHLGRHCHAIDREDATGLSMSADALMGREEKGGGRVNCGRHGL